MNDLTPSQYRKNDLVSLMEKIGKVIDQEHIVNNLFPGAIDVAWNEALAFDISLNSPHNVYWRFYDRYQFKNEAGKLFLACNIGPQKTQEAQLQACFEWNGSQWINKDGHDLHWYLNAVDKYELDIFF